MNVDVKWFCRLAIDHALVSAEVCQQLVTSVGEDCDLLDFAQAMMDQGLCEDLEKIQTVLDLACERAQGGIEPIEGPMVMPERTQVMAVERKTEESIEEDGELGPFEEEDDLGDLVMASLEQEALPDEADIAVYDRDEHLGEQKLSEELESATIAPPLKKAAVPDFGTEMPDWQALSSCLPEEAGEALRHILSAARSFGASDVHLSANAIPFMRLHGEIKPITEQTLDPATVENLSMALLAPNRVEQFQKAKDMTYALQLEDRSRYRVNLVQHKEGLKATYHFVPQELRSLSELGFPNHENISKLLDNHNGLILVTGPAGSGKTTTLAAMVEELNHKRYDHMITVEDPIEVLYSSDMCYITQREIGTHTKSYASALRGALREDPDIIVIGELHDLETIEMAITAAETGHLVISTLHTGNAANTLNRILGVFPPSQQQQIRAMTSESLRGVLCQQLLPKKGGGLTVAGELFVNTAAGANIIREGGMHHLPGVMQTGVSEGMRSMDQSLYELFKAGEITEELALSKIKSREFSRRVQQAVQGDDDDGFAGAAGKKKTKKGWFK
ncbi:MAG: PilT/PilU family type 4a pilus ATPase [Lentisphaeria bacterium]|nr:PilT/PilU family type 4a pilus ATPase [Lentisphaeria bacterium]